MGSKRELGTVECVTFDYDHGDPPVMHLMIRFSGFGQGFGGLAMDRHESEDFKVRLCRLLDVNRIEDAAGKQVYGLWCRGRHNESMEGLESLSGERFTITGFRRVHWPEKTTSALDDAKRLARSEIEYAARRLREAKDALLSLDEDWTEWETAPATVSK